MGILRDRLNDIAKKHGGIAPAAINDIIQFINNQRLDGLKKGLDMASDVLNEDAESVPNGKTAIDSENGPGK